MSPPTRFRMAIAMRDVDSAVAAAVEDGRRGRGAGRRGGRVHAGRGRLLCLWTRNCGGCLPVVTALAPKLPGTVSVDTYKAEVAKQSLEAGALMINDISALRMDPQMVDVVRDANVRWC